MTDTEFDVIRAALFELNAHPFPEACEPPIRHARECLAGRSHYVDKSTLDGFKAKIRFTGTAHRNLVLWLVEFVGSRPGPENTHRHRFAAFDVLGTRIRMSGTDTGTVWYPSARRAMDAGVAFAGNLDVVAYYVNRITERAGRMQHEAHAALAALKRLPAQQPAQGADNAQ
jgi:hypothetical protein